MKKYLMLAGAMMLLATAAFATPCAVITTTTGDTGTLLNDASDVCTIAAGESFTNFSVFMASGFGSTPTQSFSLTVSVNGDQLIFVTPTLIGEDIEVYFKTTPGITQVVLGTGPADSAVEGICAGLPNESVGSEVCPGSAPFLNNSVLSSTNGSTSTSTVQASAIDWFIKDDSGGSQFTQNFIPEPMTLSLMGIGLLGLGLLGRRLKK